MSIKNEINVSFKNETYIIFIEVTSKKNGNSKSFFVNLHLIIDPEFHLASNLILGGSSR